MVSAHPIIRMIDSLIADQERTPAQLWLERAAANLKRMEDGDLASPTVAGVPSGLSPCGSQAKPLIDYREGEEA